MADREGGKGRVGRRTVVYAWLHKRLDNLEGTRLGIGGGGGVIRRLRDVYPDRHVPQVARAVKQDGVDLAK